jgi:serine/threonine-protein kinase
VASCSDVAALTSPVPVPSDNASQERAAAILAKLTRAKALYDAGNYAGAVELARTAVTEASELGHRPTEAESLFLLGRVEEKLGDYEAAAGHQEKALERAEAGRHDALVADAEVELVFLMGQQLKADQGLALSHLAAASMERLGGRPLTEAALDRALGALYRLQGRYEDATTHYEQSRLKFERQLGPSHPQVGAANYNLGLVLWEQGKVEEADPHVRRALAILETALGPTHPQVGKTLTMLGIVLAERGLYVEALRVQQRCLDVLTQSLGTDHIEVGIALSNLGETERRMGDSRAALDDGRRAVAVCEAAHGGVDTAMTRQTLGQTYLALDDLGSARREFEEALAIRLKLLGAEHPDVAATRSSLAECSARAGRWTEALAGYDQALASLRAMKPPPTRVLVPTLVGHARALLGVGRVERAIAELQEVLAIQETHPSPPPVLADAQQVLVRAMLARGQAGERHP